MEFRLRFYDTINESNTRTQKTIRSAVAKAFLLANEDIHAFAEKENVFLNEANVDAAREKLTIAIDRAVTDILKPERPEE